MVFVRVCRCLCDNMMQVIVLLNVGKHLMSPPTSERQNKKAAIKKCYSNCSPLSDHMSIEEHAEEDEEPPLLLSSCPSCSTFVHVSCVDHQGEHFFAKLGSVSGRCLAVVDQRQCRARGQKDVCVYNALQARSLQR